MNRGHTFIELLVVLAIIGILSSLAIPDLSSFKKRIAIESTARIISTDLREERIKALLDQKEYTIYFDPVENLYHFPHRKVSLPQGIRFGFSQGVLGPPSEPVKTPDDDGITFLSNRVIFYPRGSNTIGTIYITNNTGQNMAITLSITGRVRIWKWNGKIWL